MASESVNFNQIRELQDIARRVAATRLAPATRARILDETRRRTGGMAPLAALWSLSGQFLAAAALLMLLALPALLQRGPGAPAAKAPEGELDLSVELRPDGTVVLEWENGDSVHTVRVAATREELAKVSAIEVRGGRFTDAARPRTGGPDIVFYQVD